MMNAGSATGCQNNCLRDTGLSRNVGRSDITRALRRTYRFGRNVEYVHFQSLEEMYSLT